MSDGDGPAAREVDGEDADREPTDADGGSSAADGARPAGNGTAHGQPSGGTEPGVDPGPPGNDDTVPGGADDGTGIDPASVDVAELIGPRQELDPRIRLVWVLRTGLASLVLGGLAGAAGVLTSLPAWTGPAVFTVAFALGATLALARYRSWSYRVREDSLFLDRGVVTRVQTVVPYVRIQHVDASRGPVERLFGLSTVVVYTAGSRGADVSIPGLTPDRAEDLQTRLKRLAIAAEGEDAV